MSAATAANIGIFIAFLSGEGVALFGEGCPNVHPMPVCCLVFVPFFIVVEYAFREMASNNINQ